MTARRAALMKITIEVDCTPEEARSFMGLPDVSMANNVYVENLIAAMRGVSDPSQLEQYASALAPMGQAGLKLFQSFVEGGMKMATGGGAGTTTSAD
jgi:phenylalanyl-tRNA synthetase beta subunit